MNKVGLGIKDKNNVEIFCNDRINYLGHIGVIEYSVSECKFYILWEDGNIRSINEDFAKEIEII